MTGGGISSPWDAASRAGRPIVGLLALAALWLLVRLVMAGPLAPGAAAASVGGLGHTGPAPVPGVAPPVHPVSPGSIPAAESGSDRYPLRVALPPLASAEQKASGHQTGRLEGERYRLRVVLRPPPARTDAVAAAAPAAPGGAMLASAHGAMFLQAFARLPAAVAATGAGQVAQPAPAFPGAGRRWSLDAWALVREDGSQAVLAPLPGTLGGNQAGFVARYRLAPRSSLQPAIYARASKALAENGETEAALGVEARPLGAVPLRLHAELRATDVGERSFIRPALFATGGLYDAPIGGGLLARGYLQAGYVGGDFATGFVDGHLVAERSVVEAGRADMRLGAGVWGGAQQGLHRVDVGPVLSYGFTIAGKPVRLQADYRFRVSGEAAPGSGAALTLSTSF
jgi:hypothetical protein